MRTLLTFVLFFTCGCAYAQKAKIHNPESSQDRVISVTGKGLEGLSEKQFIDLPKGQYTGTMECMVAGKKYINQFEITVGEGDENLWLFIPSESCSPTLVIKGS